MGMRIRLLGFIVCIIILTMIIFSSPSGAIKVKIEKEDIEIKVGKYHNVTIKSEDGVINYTWEIQDYDSDKIEFSFRSEKENILEPKESQKQRSGDISVEAGEHYFSWYNNNPYNKSFKIKYTIEYPAEYEGRGCYSSILVLSFILITIFFWIIIGYIKRR
jgi:hypothetical protein